MARQKKLLSEAVTFAEGRVAGLKSINVKLDLGKGVSVKALEDGIDKLKADIGVYNTELSLLDEKANSIRTEEKALKTLAVRALKGVAAQYGEDSSEYEKAGGVRASERKKPARKVK